MTLNNKHCRIAVAGSAFPALAAAVEMQHGMNGVVMSMLKGINSPKCVPAGRDMRRRSHSAASSPDVGGRSWAVTASARQPVREAGRSFDDDFKLEHSHGNVAITLTSISANAGLAENAMPQDSRFHSLHSPNCVYIG